MAAKLNTNLIKQYNEIQQQLDAAESELGIAKKKAEGYNILHNYFQNRIRAFEVIVPWKSGITPSYDNVYIDTVSESGKTLLTVNSVSLVHDESTNTYSATYHFEGEHVVVNSSGVEVSDKFTELTVDSIDGERNVELDTLHCLTYYDVVARLPDETNYSFEAENDVNLAFIKSDSSGFSLGRIDEQNNKVYFKAKSSSKQGYDPQLHVYQNGDAATNNSITCYPFE